MILDVLNIVIIHTHYTSQIHISVTSNNSIHHSENSSSVARHWTVCLWCLRTGRNKGLRYTGKHK